ncbi:MAG: cytochrome c biogenesis protein CcsA [bacterium]|nr:cytochrome c biogenesis protein CcsA [bacterium]
MNFKIKNRWVLFLLAAVVMLSSAAMVSVSAESSPDIKGLEDLDALKRVVILEHGRKKPLDTFAQNLLKQFSARSKLNKRPAIEWLARVIFTPDLAHDDKVFLVTNAEVLDSVGLERHGESRDRYSFNHLKPGLTRLRQLAIEVNKIEPNSRGLIDNELFSLYNKLYIYQQLSASFQFLLPHSDFAITNSEVAKVLGLPENRGDFCLFDIYEKKSRVLELLDAAQKKPPAELTEVEKTIVELSRRMMGWANFYRDLPLTIVPGTTVIRGQEEEKWLSPSDLLDPKRGNDDGVAKALPLMRDFVRAYRVKDQEQFNTAVAAFDRMMLEEAGENIREKAVSLEVTYNRIDPFYKTKFYYGFAALLLLLSFIVMERLEKWFYRGGYLLLLVGFAIHAWGVVARMIIMNRPPITNLYETFVFVGLIVALLGIILELYKKKNIGILTGSITGLAMLMIAGKYALEGDTMGMLVAVLDSNFWLATHVITIILGYAGIVLSGVIGHIYVIQRLFWPKKTEMLKNTFQAIYGTQAFGLIFSFIGTMLGGVWADQSWGRFWGWDPKENGALLIVIWSSLIFHARLCKWMREVGFALGAAAGTIAVALAWFGVNLLGVGLHSYGFISGIANSLFIFVAFELFFIAIMGFLLRGEKEEVTA